MATLNVNGEPVDQLTVSGTLSAWQETALFTLGTDPARGGSRWSGWVYRLALYARALTAAEIRQNHAARPDADAAE